MRTDSGICRSEDLECKQYSDPTIDTKRIKSWPNHNRHESWTRKSHYDSRQNGTIERTAIQWTHSQFNSEMVWNYSQFTNEEENTSPEKFRKRLRPRFHWRRVYPSVLPNYETIIVCHPFCADLLVVRSRHHSLRPNYGLN